MQIFENEPMKFHTSFKVGGPARYFIKAENLDDLKSAQALAKDKSLPFFILGNGTNLLVSDSGYNGIIVNLGKSFSEVQNLGGGKFKVGARVSLGAFARKTIKLGYSGIHKLAGVPGTLGGAIYMNAGAYGQEIAQTCTEVESIAPQGNVVKRAFSECMFSYRHSIFQDLAKQNANSEKNDFCEPSHGEIILSAIFQLEPATTSGKDCAMLEAEMQECMAKRKSSQPLAMPNAGSTFKRLAVGSAEMPQQIAPGYYIEQAGLKGFRMGGAEVSQVHANFIVNAGGATAADIKNLSEHVQKTVAQKFGIQLQREIILLGEF